MLYGWWAAWAAITAALYLLPLSQPATDTVSDLSFMVGAVSFVSLAAAASRRTTGVDRLAWGAVATTLFATTIVFALTPASANDRLSPALFMAPGVALAVMRTIVLFGRHALTRLGVWRVLSDTAWLTSGLLSVVWPVAMEPLPELVESRSELLLLDTFPIISIAAGVTVVILLPHSAGSARWSLASFGAGTATLAAAGATQIRLALAGNLVFGTPDDYLWTVGIGLMGIAALDPQMGQRLRPANPHFRTQQIITLAPVVCVVISIVFNGWAATPKGLVVVMLMLLAVRVTLLVAENGRLNRQLRRQANTDTLTGLMNRRALMEHLSPRTERAAEASHAVLYLDLDSFKLVNDQHGHAAGDHVLSEVSRRLQRVVREVDLVARFGGDEFVVITDAPDPAGLAARLQLAVATPVIWEGMVLEVGCSVGVACGPVRSTAQLMAEADAALYRAKAAGRNQVDVAP